MKINALKSYIESGKLNEKLASLYGEDQILMQKTRYIKAIDGYAEEYGRPDDDVQIFSVSGRSAIIYRQKKPSVSL